MGVLGWDRSRLQTSTASQRDPGRPRPSSSAHCHRCLKTGQTLAGPAHRTCFLDPSRPSQALSPLATPVIAGPARATPTTTHDLLWHRPPRKPRPTRRTLMIWPPQAPYIPSRSPPITLHSPALVQPILEAPPTQGHTHRGPVRPAPVPPPGFKSRVFVARTAQYRGGRHVSDVASGRTHRYL